MEIEEQKEEIPVQEIQKPKGKTGKLGPYFVMRTLGKGFTAKIKLGYDPENKRYAALKILKDSLGLKVDKTVKSEVEALKNLSHPNIIKIFEFS